MRDKLCLLVWALTLHIVPLHAQEGEDHSNDDIQNPNTPIKLVRPFPCIPLFPYFRSQTPTVSLYFCPKTPLLSIAQFLHGPYLTNVPTSQKQTTNFHCVNIYKLDPTLNPSQSPTKLCPDDSPFSSYNYDIWLSCGFPHDGPERTSPTKYLHATWLSHITLSWQSDSAILDERYTLIQTSWLDMQQPRTRTSVQRGCNPRKEVELNPYWVDFEKVTVGRDGLTWGDGGLEYDKGIRNSVCGKDDEGGKDGPFNTDGFTKETKITTTGGGGGGEGGRGGWDDNIKGLNTPSGSFFLPIGETSLVDVDDDVGITTTPPLLSSTSPDEDTGKPIDPFLFSSAAPSSPSIALPNNNVNNNNNFNGQATPPRSDPNNLFIRRRTRKRAAAAVG